MLSKLRKVRELGVRGTISRLPVIGREAVHRAFPASRMLPAARHVRERTGKSIAAQAREIRELHRGPGRVRAFDYYAYGLYDDRVYSPAARADFVGWTYEECLSRLWSVNDPAWSGLCDDKLISYALFRGLGLPFPEVLAVFSPAGRRFGSVPSLRTDAELADFLRDGMRYPFFGKPASDAFGRGASSVRSLDADRDLLLLADGREIGVDEYVRTVPGVHHAGRKKDAKGQAGGYLFQQLIVQHPTIHRVSGGRVSSLRMVVLLGADGPQLFRVTWKLPVGANITDHAIGTSGNLKCAVDPGTGRVEQVLRGRGPGGTPVYGIGFHGTPVESHPDTSERIAGLQLPYWDRTVKLCLDAASSLPGLRYQSWDLVMGVDGPMVLELNAQGGIAQMPGGPGLNDTEFRRFMAECGRP